MRLWPEEAERAVLGAILCAASWSADAGHRVARRVRDVGLDPEHFWLASHGELYRTILRMVSELHPLDPVSVAAELDRNHVDPRVVARLHVLAYECPVVTGAERYARIVVDAAAQREIKARA